MSTSERKEWRKNFTEAIMALTAGKLDVLDAAHWALQAQHAHGHRDPLEVAREQFRDDKPPPPLNIGIPEQALQQTPQLPAHPEFLLPKPGQSGLGAGTS
jgi:hypothetical protein